MKNTVLRLPIVIVIFSLLFCQVVHADLAQDLRQLRNTVSETSRTSKEFSDLAGSVGSTEKPSITQVSEGDMLISKIDNIKLYQEADKKAKVIAKLSKRDGLIYSGVDANGFYSVNANGNEGWVEKILVKKH